MNNIYWPVYKNLEIEVVKLSYDIHIDDKQINVYSSKITDLILRAATEIESISKELYKNNGGTKVSNIKYDYDALTYLNDKWLLEKKIVIISHFNCFQSNKELTPFIRDEIKPSKNNKKTFSWNNAYQNLKHDRSNSLEYGSIKYLFDIMSALFILNIYYKNDIYDLKSDASATNLSANMGSELFSVKIHVSGHSIKDSNIKYLKKPDFDQCVYLVKLKEDSENKEIDVAKKMDEENWNLLIKHPKFAEYIANNKVNEYKGNNFMWDVLGQEEYTKIIRKTSGTMLKIIDNLYYEAIINKNDF